MLICKVICIQSLSSGSRGNAIYISSDTTRILVDVGLNMTQLKKRCAIAGIDLDTIDAVLVTHEHSDHIIGLKDFFNLYTSDLYLHTDTVDVINCVPTHMIKTFDKQFTIGDITVDHFPVPHDSRFCFGYSFKNGDTKISLATDLGRIGDDIINAMNGSQIVMLECNHDLLKLSHNRKYPHFLKRRITASSGHLSNPSCALACSKLAKMGVTQIILAHISSENNSPNLAYSFVKDFLEKQGIIEGRDIWIDVATQDCPTVAFICGDCK